MAGGYWYVKLWSICANLGWRKDDNDDDDSDHGDSDDDDQDDQDD